MKKACRIFNCKGCIPAHTFKVGTPLYGDQSVSREPDELLTTEDAAARVGVSPVTLKVWRWRRNPHAPPHVTVGARSVRYSASELERWKQLRTHQPGGNVSRKDRDPQRQQRRRGPQ